MEPESLTAPVQHDYNDPTVERNVERLRLWLTNLPLLDVVKTLRLVQGGLDSLNEQKLEPERRYQLLEVFRDTAERLYATVDPIYMRQLNLTSSQRELATAGLERLLAAMAGGYKILVKTLYESAAHGSPPVLFGQAIHRAIEQLGYVLLDNYRAYRTVPGSLFGELNQLYRLARHFGLLAVCATDNEAEQPHGTAECYHAIMLLSLTDPFRLAEGEVALLYEILKTHAGACRVTPGNQWSGDSEGVFQLDLCSDSPPRRCSDLEHPAADVREPYLLDARNMLASIGTQLERIPVRVRMQSPEAVLLRRLASGDMEAKQNREARHPDSRQTMLIIGLHAIHARLLALRSGRSTHAERETSTDPVGTLSCRIEDSSDNGMRLVCEAGQSGDARVADLVGILGEGHRLQLAITRSVQYQRSVGIELGVQKIHGSCGPVYCRTLMDDATEEIEALFIPASEDEGVAATLVTLNGFYEPGRRLLVNSFGREVKARAGRNISDSLLFDRFEFAVDDS